MRLHNRQLLLIVFGVIFTMALPIYAAISLARQQAIDREEHFLTGLARSALAKSEMTGEQLGDGARVVNALNPAIACSPRGLDLMREVDLSSTLLQAIGWIDGNVIRCSSFGGHRDFDLGPPDIVSGEGARFWTEVELIDPHLTYLAVATGNSVGIVHKDLALSFVENVPGLAVGVFNWSDKRILMSRGPVNARWLGGNLGHSRVFHSGNHLVAVVHSTRYDIGAVAALPASHFSGYVWEAAKLLIPIGAAVGIALSLALIYVARNRASMPMMIRTALKRGKFHLLYQPVVDLASGRTVGVEALIRWQRAKNEIVSPEIFIPAAEQAGLTPLITARVLELLADDARDIHALAPALYFAVNFSADDMYRADVIDRVDRLVERSGIAFDNLVVEATERSLFDVEAARGTMRRLRAKGIKIAIDDFGTGYSSLAYLAQLELDYLKIDRLFVQSLGTDSATSQVAGRIIDMAKDLKLKIVAEGVETGRQEVLLRNFGVETAQGFLFGRPMAIEELLQRLRAERQTRAPEGRREAA